MMFEADREGPAWLNGEVVSVSKLARLSEALVVTGSEKELDPHRPPLATAQSLAPHVQKIRILGAAALDICQVASGAVDGFVQNGLYLWDIAAAGLIVERAGGVFSALPVSIAGRYACLAAANETLATALKKFL
jgi:myo-inositol-1(or 4)-monophosphatase